MADMEKLSTERARAAVEAALEEGRKQGVSLAVAVVDDGGNLLYFGRRHQQPGRADSSIFVHMSINKAYTSAMLRRDTRVLREENAQYDRSLLSYGNPRFTDIIGGVFIKSSEGNSLGAIGVSGLSEEGDEETAFIGLKAMSL